jgi:hypothetical protein
MKKIYFLISIVVLNISVYGQELTTLENQFKTPPQEAKPRTWMHVMSGNMSKVGLTKDLEAMADAGIGGIILFNVTHKIPDGNVKFNSPEHIEMTAHAAAECERLGLTFGVHNCDGWTSSGGPWVTPEHSMKQVVYSQELAKGGAIEIKLKTPSQVGDYYKDVAVLAYPALQSEIDEANNLPTIKSSDKNLNLDIINDGSIDNKTALTVEQGTTEWIDFQYQKPFTLKSIYINFHTRVSAADTITLKVSDNGKDYKKVQVLKPQRMGKIEHGIDLLFDGITSKYFRLESTKSLDLTEIDLSTVQRFDNMLARTSLFKLENIKIPEIKVSEFSDVIDESNIINLTASMDEEGNLTAKLPEGNWTIMRFGYTITRAVNGPASEEGTGWEVDKMSRESFKIFYEGYVRNVIEASKKVAPNALQYIEIDSYEVGGQNWTKDYEISFKEHFGYDILDFLPIYAGRYIGNAETTDRVLWDVRNYNSKLMTDNYFDYFTELCHNDGLISYVEPYSFNAGFNELDAAKNVDITMGEFWMHQRYQTETAVSAARIYGKKVVSAESFSAQSIINWKGHPGTLKLTGDKAWTLGINEFMFHRYAHQANTNVKPGMTMSEFGSHIDRTQTWWDNAGKAWFKYLARGQYMLRQGIPVSGVLAFVGDGSPNSNISRAALKLPNYINYDCVNADALLNRITVKDKKLVFPDGLTYYVLHLSNTKEMQLSTLRRIADIANQGVPIVGNKPGKIGGYNNTETDIKEFNTLINTIWSKSTTYTKIDWDLVFKEQNIPVDLFIEEGQDINYIHKKTTNEDIYFFYNPDSKERTYHCTFNLDGKIPELWNQMTGEITKLGAFEHINGKTNVAIKLPAEGSGFIVFRESSKGVKSISTQSASKLSNAQFQLNNSNKAKIEISKNGIYDIAFSNNETQKIEVNNLLNPIEISKNWQVTFTDIKSKNKTFSFPTLIDWTKHENEEIKYYSGTAIYKTDFDIKKAQIVENNKFTLNLGEVNVAARVILNDIDLGVIWKSPYALDISAALQKGKNTLVIELTNQWTNRLIGDENYPNVSGYELNNKVMPDWYINNEPANLGERSTFTTYPFYKKGDELLPAGLVGPVKIKTSIIKQL